MGLLRPSRLQGRSAQRCGYLKERSLLLQRKWELFDRDGENLIDLDEENLIDPDEENLIGLDEENLIDPDEENLVDRELVRARLFIFSCQLVFRKLLEG